MPCPLEALAEEVLQLVPDARARLLDRVVASLDEDLAHDAAWDALAEARDVELESGEAVATPVEQVLARLGAELE